MTLTQHAKQRTEQRSIPQAAIDLILDWGKVEHHKGREIYRLDKKGMRRVRRYLGKVSEGPLAQLRGIYIVVDDDEIVTVARQTQHHKRERH